MASSGPGSTKASSLDANAKEFVLTASAAPYTPTVAPAMYYGGQPVGFHPDMVPVAAGPHGAPFEMSFEMGFEDDAGMGGYGASRPPAHDRRG